MANILKRWIENDNHEVKRISKIADQVDALSKEFEALSDEELQQKKHQN